MNVTTPALPEPHEVAELVKGWAATNPKFAALLATGTPTPQALARWSVELLHGNRTAEAIAVLRAALGLTPGDAALWTNYGAALNQENSPDAAAACLEHSLALSRQQPDTWLLLGLVRKKSGDAGAAEAAYRVALEQEPDSLAAWQLLGLLKQEQRDYAAAIDCLNACVRAGAADAAVLANLGKLCHEIGRFPEACAAYTRAAALDAANPLYRRMARKCGFLRALIQGESVDAAIAAFRSSFPPGESCTEKELMDLLNSALPLLSGFGHLDAAVRVGRKQLELRPTNPSAAYMLKAVTGDAGLDRAAPEYVIEHFDAFAAGFDAQLVGTLGYDIPEKLCAAVRGLGKAGQLYDTLDAGCGTGLCGPLLRSVSRALTGVDLSPKMLEQAKRRGVYDALACEELTTFLGRNPAQFDLMVAADVLIYFGDVDPIFTGAAIALRQGGLLAFSTETLIGAGYRLQPSGRFAHAAEYVRSVAAAEFEELACLETTSRLEAGVRLPGNLFIFRRRRGGG